MTNATVQLSSRAFESYATNLKTMNANLKTLFEERNENELNRQLNKIIGLSSLAIFTHMQITDTIDNILNTQSVHKILELIDTDLIDREIEKIHYHYPQTHTWLVKKRPVQFKFLETVLGLALYQGAF